MAIKFDSILGELRESDAGASNTTASNIGTDGVGLFKQKTADNLEFYNLVGDSGSLIGVETPDINGNIVLLPNAGAIFESGISGNEANIDHNQLGGLQGGTVGEFYHLTVAQHTIVGNTSGTNTGDNATNTQYSGLASSKQDALSGTGFVKISGTTISYDNSTYLTSLSGAVLISQATPQTIGDTTNRLLKLWATDITVTNAITGSITGNAGTVTTNANLTGPITSVGNATSIASQTGTGTKFVMDNTPTLITPVLGVATGTSLALTGTASIGTTLSSSADLRINSTATHESSLYAGIWQSTSYNPVGTPVAGTSVRGLLFQVSTPNVADDLSNVILYGALGQVTHGGSGALGQAIGMNPGVFLTGSGAVTTSAGITVSATASGGGAHTTWFGLRAGGITLSGGSTMVNSYAFYADAVTGATNNYAWLSNAGLFVINETGDANSDFRVEGDTNANLLFVDASADCVGINVTAPAGKLDIQQTSTTATIPTLILDQSDLSEEFIQFESTVGAGNPIDTAALGTYYGKIRISVNGTFKFMALYNT